MLDTLRLLVDFGLVVLIWLVQLVVYPSFGRFARADLLRWHPVYTRRVSFVVLPLMVAQLGLALVELGGEPIVGAWWSAAFVAVAWVVTFAWSVGCHRRIAEGRDTPRAIASLLRSNAVRTVAWTAVFAVDWLRLR